MYQNRATYILLCKPIVWNILQQKNRTTGHSMSDEKQPIGFLYIAQALTGRMFK